MGSLIALGALLFLVLVWGTQFLVIKVGLRTVPPLLTVALRFAIVAVASQLVVWGLRIRAPPGALRGRVFFGFAQAVSMGTLYWSQGHLPSALAGILVATEPLLVALIAPRLVPGERVGFQTVVALALGFVGLAFITFGQASGGDAGRLELVAVFVVVLGCVAGALNKVVGKRLAVEVPAPVAMRDMGVAVAVVLGAASLVLERERTVEFTASAVMAFTYLGLVASTAASTVYFLLLRRFPVTALGYLQFVTALVAVATGIALGHEHLGLELMVGSAAILAGLVVLATRFQGGAQGATSAP